MLTVYRASAGAGKTHKLTGEYLRLLFSHPGAYRRILAVTFTNKATDEMKGRIVEELYNLSSEKKSDYVDLLSSFYSLTEDQVRERAKQILIAILHDYSAFNVSTIDRFFQQTMRAFTREVGLQGGYGIEMDQALVLTESIDNMLADLEKPENKDLLGWLLRFAEDKVENGGEWSLRRDIYALATEVFKESYKAYSDEVEQDIADKKTLESYKDELFLIIRSIESEVRKTGEKGLSFLKNYGLQPSDFKGGSRSPIFLFERWAKGEMKEPTATFAGLADNLDGCFTKTTPPAMQQIIGCVFNDGLNDCIKSILAIFSNLTSYYTSKEIVRYYYTLGILTDISRTIGEWRAEKNVMLIADTTELLNKVIGGSDAPFIYEKTGTYVDHYMIDEFQDTSGMQWNNFKPLIEESLSNNQENLIVGDVKQSIYRFRNSDWKLLDEQIRQDFMPELLKEDTLKDNWRSCKYIVDFNNAFFTIAPVLLQNLYNEILEVSSLSSEKQDIYYTKIISAYDKSYQFVPPVLNDKKGHVRIDFLENEEGKTWKDEALNRLPVTIERLQSNGYRLKDIAILVRTNQEAAIVADAILAYKEEHKNSIYHYDIISDEALFISSSSSVRLFIALMRYLKNPGDKTNEQMALLAYRVVIGGYKDENEKLIRALPLELISALKVLSRQSLYETTEGLFRLFSAYFPENEQVFIQAFLDMVSEFSQKESADLGLFLKWWEDTGYKKTVATPEGQNAIRILTVHKSKGLGFKAVLIPFGDWEIDHKPTKPVILWCRPQEKPFNKLHLVPVRYGQILGNTIFAEDYFKERLHAFIDNLNTLYVAFTRAKEELIVFAPSPKKLTKDNNVEKITSVADLLWAGICVEDINTTREGFELISLSSEFNLKEHFFELGNWWIPSKEQKSGDARQLSMKHIRSFSPDDRLRLRLHGKGFFFDNEHRKHGTLMHEILSRIRIKEDISSAVDNYRISGIINKDEAGEVVLRLQNLLNTPDVQNWYDGSFRILNEVDILFGKGFSKRPDRVMINGSKVVVVDYKFGERQDKRHQYQVRNYLNLIKEMGYSEIYGYLWYVELNKIERVKI